MAPMTKKEWLDAGDAFLPDVARTHERLVDDEAESFAEEFIAEATSAEYVGEDARDEMVAEELGGPFLTLVRDKDAKTFKFETEDEAEK